MPRGSLTVVGTGYRIAGQVTAEAQAAMAGADRLFYLSNDPVTGRFLETLHPLARSLYDCYREGRDGLACSLEMVERIVAPLSDGLEVCAAFYGHPAIFVHTSHEAMRRARAGGSQARMLPGVSALDCLYADLGFDPAPGGCRVFEATDFLVHRRLLDPSVPLVLLQAGAVAITRYRRDPSPNREGLRLLAERLAESHPRDHEAIVYEVGGPPLWDPVIERVPLAKLPDAGVSVASTLFVPASRPAVVDAAMARRIVGPS